VKLFATKHEMDDLFSITLKENYSSKNTQKNNKLFRETIIDVETIKRYKRIKLLGIIYGVIFFISIVFVSFIANRYFSY